MTPIYYDARLVSVTDAGMVLEYQGKQLELPTFQPPNSWLLDQVGKTGIAEYVEQSACWRFTPYLDQSLRRVFELDYADRIGWRNEEEPDGWTAPRCVVPGENGAFIEADTEEVTLAVPQEFIGLCEQYQLTPEEILHGFIADAAGLMNYVRSPRADGYSSNGSDERGMAQDYLDRAYGMRRGD